MALAALAAALVSCSREKEVEVVEPAGDVTYRFELVEGTRATLNDDGVWWDASDHVGVFLGSENKNAEVEGTDTKYVVVDGPSGVSKGYAYYPYNDANTSAGSVNVVFPKDQIGGSQSAMPMAGIPFDVTSGTFNGQIHSLNLGSVIDFRVYSPSGKYAGEQVKSITFAATEGSHLAGTAKLDLTAVNPANESTLAVNWEGGSPQSSVTLTQTSASALDKVTAEGRHLYMVVAPGTYSGTISIVTNAATYSYTVTDKQFVRGGLHRYNMSLESSAATRAISYVKITSAQELTSGGSYLIVYKSSDTEGKMFHPVLNNDGSTYAGNAVAVVLSGNRLVANAEAESSLIVLEKSGNSYTIKVPSAGNKNLYLASGSSNLKVGDYANNISVGNDGGATINRSNTQRYLYYGNNSFSSSNTSSTLYFYKPDDGGLQAQSPQFSADSFLYTITGQTLPVVNVTGVPTLSGAQTTVTYYSSDNTVATVDASNGQVTIKGAGKTTITAVAEANNVYRQGIASYILRVNDGFSVENDRVAAFLDYEEAHPYNPSDYSYTYVMDYRSGTGENNRLDIPQPVPVTWTTSVSNAKVAVYNDSAHNDEETMALVENITSTSADVYNLVPGRTYYYVVKEGDQVKAEGSFKTTGRRRMILVGDHSYGRCYANNCRDFGGQIGMNGRRVKFGKIYRGTNMDYTTDTQKNYLIQKMDIRLDVDLRVENAKQDNTDPGKYKVKDDYALDPTIVTRTTEQYNSWSDLSNTTRMKGTLGAIFDYVTGSNNKSGAVYIHCKIGSDRTGYVCLLLEALLGIPQHLCDVDYELTSFCGCLDGGETRTRDNTSQTWYYYRRDGISFLTGSTLQGTTLQEKAVNYVKSMGFTDAQITAFQEAMLEPVNQ